MRYIKFISHGFLFAAGSAIFIYNKSDSKLYVPPNDVIYPTIFSITVYLLLLLILHLLTRRLEVSGLIASLMVLAFFYNFQVFIGVLLITLISLLLIKRIYKKGGFGIAHSIVNAISLVVVSSYYFQFIMLLVNLPWAVYKTTILPIRDLPGSLPISISSPDIYYIILDSYGSEKMLQTIYDYDNSEFSDALEQKGFVIATHTLANYPMTLLSLSSSLNMQYLENMSTVMGDSNLWWPVMDTIHHSEVRKVFQNWGYKLVFFASGWDYSDIRDGDLYEAPYPVMLKNFENLFMDSTNLNILRGIDRFGVEYATYDTHRQVILYSFKRLPEIAALPGPKFVFAHIISPHPPYVFDRVGDPVNPDYSFSFVVPTEGDIIEYRNSYIDQLIFTSKEILITIDSILANSINPPIIILQSDHGPGILFDNNSIENSCLSERFSILNAYYLPNIDKNSIPMDLSPVNSFRFILNQYFQSKLDLLSNHQYFSTKDNFFQFTDITNNIQGTCNTISDDNP